MSSIATRLGIRITDGAIFPYTALTEKQHDMRPWNGPMDPEWLIDSREARQRRLQWLQNDRGAYQVVERGKPFSIATASKEELLDYAANEFGQMLNPKLPVLILRRQVLSLETKRVEQSGVDSVAEAEAGDAAADAAVAAEPAVAAAESATTRARGLGRRAA